MRVFSFEHRRFRRRLYKPASILILALVTGCSGSGSSGLPASPAQSQSGSHKTAHVTFTMHWNSTTPSSARIHRAYVPSTAQSVSVAVNGGSAQYLNAPATTLTIDAPVGTDLFTFQTYDEQNGEGNLLSQAEVTQAIIDGDANVVTAVLNGVVASLALSLSNASPNAGASASIAVHASAKDADGNTIVGASDYSTPILLSINDPANSGTLSFSANSLASPAATSNLLYNGGTLWSATISASTSSSSVSPVSVTFAPAPTFYYYSLPVSSSAPLYITPGRDGNMWFTEGQNNKVGKITPSGAITEYTIPTADAFPEGITQGSDGRLWFAEYLGSKIGAITTSGTFTEYKTQDYPSDTPLLLIDRGDGTIWYTSPFNNHVGQITETTGNSFELSIPTGNSSPYGLAQGIDGNLYFGESNVGQIGYLASYYGSITEFLLPAQTQPQVMVRGPDGQIWFTESGSSSVNTGKIGVINTRGSPYLSAQYQTVSPNSYPTGITAGADGALWFTESGLDAIGRVTTDGTVTEYKSPVTGLNLVGIAAAPNGTLWFPEPGSSFTVGRIGELVY
jgi:streptogramin lyase